ncbi:MAG TPA: MFS transporter, partial [Coxiellaceae bacterium]|nr:MFS transporter [Coxiellaceae bacterium]
MKTSNKIVIFFFGALGGLLFGYDTGIIASALVYIKGDLQLTPIGEAWVVSGIILGAAIGAIGSGFLSDKVGRKKVVFIEAVIFTAGSLGCALSITATQLILFRFVLGLAVGGASALVPLYLSEMAPKEIRGALSALNQVMIITGIVMASIIGYILTSSADGWRIMLGLGVVPSIIMALGALMIPESPRWLIAKNKEAEARAVLLKTRSQTIAEEEIIEIKRVVALEDKGIREITDKWVRPLLWLGIFLAILQQFTGINAVVYFTPTILVGLGVAPADAILYNVGLGVVML